MEFADGRDVVYAGKRGTQTAMGKPVGGRLDGGSSDIETSILYGKCVKCTFWRGLGLSCLTSVTGDFVHLQPESISPSSSLVLKAQRGHGFPAPEAMWPCGLPLVPGCIPQVLFPISLLHHLSLRKAKCCFANKRRLPLNRRKVQRGFLDMESSGCCAMPERWCPRGGGSGIHSAGESSYC